MPSPISAVSQASASAVAVYSRFSWASCVLTRTSPRRFGVMGSLVLSMSHEALALSVWRGPFFVLVVTLCPTKKPCQSTGAGRDIRCVVGSIRARTGNQLPNLSPSDAFLRSLALEQQEDLSSLRNRRGKIVEVKGKCEVSFQKKSPEPTRLFGARFGASMDGCVTASAKQRSVRWV